MADLPNLPQHLWDLWEKQTPEGRAYARKQKMMLRRRLVEQQRKEEAEAEKLKAERLSAVNKHEKTNHKKAIKKNFKKFKKGTHVTICD